jgi:hypothetical protein
MKYHAFEDWYYYNQNVIPFLFETLIQISREYNVHIFNSDKSYHQFVRMLYDESNGDIIYDPYHEPTIYNGLENIHF